MFFAGCLTRVHVGDVMICELDAKVRNEENCYGYRGCNNKTEDEYHYCYIALVTCTF